MFVVWHPIANHLTYADKNQLPDLIKQGMIPVVNGGEILDFLQTNPQIESLKDLRCKMKETKSSMVMENDFGESYDFEFKAFEVEEIGLEEEEGLKDYRSIAEFVDDRSLPKLSDLGITTCEDFLIVPEDLIAGKVPFITKKTYPDIIAKIKAEVEEDQEEEQEQDKKED